jgi:hypothetical protein
VRGSLSASISIRDTIASPTLTSTGDDHDNLCPPTSRRSGTGATISLAVAQPAQNTSPAASRALRMNDAAKASDMESDIPQHKAITTP